MLLDSFLAMCGCYGIAVVPCPRLPAGMTGPRHCGCDVGTKRIFVPLGWDVPGTAKGIAATPEVYLHEVAHVVAQPPNGLIDDVPEDWILMQVERQLARAVMPEAIDRVIGWQMDTVAELVVAPGCLLMEDPRYRRRPEWQRGYALAQKVGILNSRRRPTWRMPDWTKLTQREIGSWQA